MKRIESIKDITFYITDELKAIMPSSKSYIIKWYDEDGRELSPSVLCDYNYELFFLDVTGRYGEITLENIYRNKTDYFVAIMNKALSLCDTNWFNQRGEMYEVDSKQFGLSVNYILNENR